MTLGVPPARMPTPMVRPRPGTRSVVKPSTSSCMFLLGACSCQVKRMNPGWDLLLNVDWDGALQAIGFPRVRDYR